jgi:uncharacterized damage-inducible protein DinB
MVDSLESNDQDAVRSVLRKINESWLQGRTEELAEYFHPHIVMVHPGFAGRVEGRDAGVQSYVDFLRSAKIHEYAESDHQVDIRGDTAVASYRFLMAWEMVGKHYREGGHDLFVFNRDQGKWQAVWRTMQPLPVSAAPERYRRWFKYEKDAHEKVLLSLETVPVERRSDAAYRKALDIVAHIIAARRVWLFRFGAANDAPANLTPQGATVADLRESLRSMHVAWTDYLGRIDNGELARVFQYKSLDAGWFENRVEDILTQLFGHSWYHRGQVASLVRSAGGEPAVTDFVFWCREPIQEPKST